MRLVSLFLLLLPVFAQAEVPRCPDAVERLARVAVVDGYSSGASIAPELKRRGFEVVHVQSSPVIPKSFVASFRKEHYIENITSSDDVPATAEKLEALGVRAVIVGAEPGVERADELSAFMGLRTNGLTKSPARRNKYLMHEALKASGVPSVRHIKSKDIDEILAWAREKNEGRWPVVVKPMTSAGTEGVFICENEAQVRAAVKALLGTPTQMGRINKKVLVQEYLKGDEYVVNVVSLDGQSIVTDIWRYHKTPKPRPEGGLSNVYDRDELLSADDPIQKALIEYAKRVIDALEIKNGPAHLEIMWTDRGPVLVEAGARLMGGPAYYAAQLATGVSPTEILVDVFTEPKKFQARLEAGETVYKKKKTAWVVQLRCPRSGRILAPPPLEKIRALESFAKLDIGFKPGDMLSVTLDLITSPGYVLLVHEDPEVLRRDYECLRQIEASGELYRFE